MLIRFSVKCRLHYVINSVLGASPSCTGQWLCKTSVVASPLHKLANTMFWVIICRLLILYIVNCVLSYYEEIMASPLGTSEREYVMRRC